jgi:sepiapterin reductase
VQILFARNADGLAETARQLKEVRGDCVDPKERPLPSPTPPPPHPSLRSQLLPPSSPIVTHAFDMGDLDSIEPSFNAALEKLRASSPPPSTTYSRLLLLNNAGSLGDQTLVSQLPSVASLRAAIDVNVVAPMWLTSLVLRALPALVPAAAAAGEGAGDSRPPSVVVVNISSLAAVQPFKTQAVYCVGKAARDMLHATVAAEAGPGSGLKTLNYAPGPLDTDMNAEIRGCGTVDAGTRAFFEEMKATNTYVDTEASAAKCARIVAADKYATGAHIDFYDAEPA